MSENLLEQRQILSHYQSKLSGLGQRDGAASAAKQERTDLVDLIQQKEREIARCDALLVEQKAVVQTG